jgi:hypothetical protein
MPTMNDLVEDWIQIRSTLQRQLKLLESGELRSGGATLDATTTSTIIRLKSWINELNALLKEYARDNRT